LIAATKGSTNQIVSVNAEQYLPLASLASRRSNEGFCATHSIMSFISANVQLNPNCTHLLVRDCSTLSFSDCQIAFGLASMSAKSEKTEKALQRKYALLRRKQAEVGP
jgi:hypothetical protein